MTQYERKGFDIRQGFIPQYLAQYLRNYFELLRRNDQIPNKGDAQVEKSLGIYGDPAFDMLMLMCLPMVEESVGKKLLPTYTYARIYFNGADLRPHMDRPECQHSVSVSLGGEYDTAWPLSFRDENYAVHANLNEGDAVVYRGDKVLHWREPFQGTTQYQIFMHYVEANGPYQDKLYDTRPNIGLEAGTKRVY
tara:strand:+ start:49 stop:627 length:579 start_codon:yes stop_codon:yes gene_type:complete